MFLIYSMVSIQTTLYVLSVQSTKWCWVLLSSEMGKHSQGGSGHLGTLSSISFWSTADSQ